MIGNTSKVIKVLITPHNIKRPALLAALALALLLGTTFVAGTVRATPGDGVTATPLLSGTLPEAVQVKMKQGRGGFGNGTAVSNINIVKYVVQPGGYFGWHQHSGPVWVVIQSGTLSLYGSEDPSCTPQRFSVGNAFLDPGDHTHNARNEGTVPVEVYAVFMLPAGGPVRIDRPDPGVCPF